MSKYTSKKMGPDGKWVYTYAKPETHKVTDGDVSDFVSQEKLDQHRATASAHGKAYLKKRREASQHTQAGRHTEAAEAQSQADKHYEARQSYDAKAAALAVKIGGKSMEKSDYKIEANGLMERATKMAIGMAAKAKKDPDASAAMPAIGRLMAGGDWMGAMKLMEKVMGQTKKVTTKKSSLADWSDDVLEKAKYTSRKKGKDGKWVYTYATKKKGKRKKSAGATLADHQLMGTGPMHEHAVYEYVDHRDIKAGDVISEDTGEGPVKVTKVTKRQEYNEYHDPYAADFDDDADYEDIARDMDENPQYLDITAIETVDSNGKKETILIDDETGEEDGSEVNFTRYKRSKADRGHETKAMNTRERTASRKRKTKKSLGDMSAKAHRERRLEKEQAQQEREEREQFRMDRKYGKSLGGWAENSLLKADLQDLGAGKPESLRAWADQAVSKSKKFAEEIICAKIRSEGKWLVGDDTYDRGDLVREITDRVITMSVYDCKAELKSVMGKVGRGAVESLVHQELPGMAARKPTAPSQEEDTANTTASIMAANGLFGF